jgi:hypothetical protein
MEACLDIYDLMKFRLYMYLVIKCYMGSPKPIIEGTGSRGQHSPTKIDFMGVLQAGDEHSIMRTKALENSQNSLRN